MRLFYYLNPTSKDEKIDPIGVLRDILRDSRILVTRLSRANDPFDLQLGFSNSLSDAYIAGFQSKYCKLEEKIGVVCFSERPDSILMWSHYANCHRGFALEFELDEKSLEKVVYSTEAPQLPNETDTNIEAVRKEVFNRALRTKAIDWAYEREWRRIVKYSKNDPDIQIDGDNHFLVFPSASLKSLFVGMRSNAKDEQLKNLLNETGFGNVDVFRFERTRSGYSLQCNDYEKSLRIGYVIAPGDEGTPRRR